MLADTVRNGVALVAVAVLTWWGVNQVKQPAVRTPAVAMPPHYDLYARNFVVTTFDPQGRRARSLRGERLTHQPLAEQAEVRSPALTLFPSTGEPWMVRAATAVVPDRQDTVDLHDNVVIERALDSGGKIEMFTRNLQIRVQRQTAETRERVTIVHPQGMINGLGMSADLAAGRFYLHRDVHSILDPPRRAAAEGVQ